MEQREQSMVSNDQVLTVVAAVFRIRKEILAAVKATEADYDCMMEALVCLHDGVDPTQVVGALKTSGVDAAGLQRLRRETSAPKQQGGEEPAVEQPDRSVKISSPVVTVGGSEVVIEGKNAMQDRHKNRLFGFLMKYQQTVDDATDDVKRFKEYDAILSAGLSQEQQKEVITAINAGVPLQVIKTYAKKDTTPETMRDLAATYLKQKQEVEKKSHGET